MIFLARKLTEDEIDTLFERVYVKYLKTVARNELSSFQHYFGRWFRVEDAFQELWKRWKQLAEYFNSANPVDPNLDPVADSRFARWLIEVKDLDVSGDNRGNWDSLPDVTKNSLREQFTVADAFRQFAYKSIKNHIINLGKKKVLDPQSVSEMGTEEGEEWDIPDVNAKNPTKIDDPIEVLKSKVPKPYDEIIDLILDEYEYSNIGKLWKKIKEKYGLSQWQVLNFFKQNPELREILKEKSSSVLRIRIAAVLIDTFANQLEVFDDGTSSPSK